MAQNPQNKEFTPTSQRIQVGLECFVTDTQPLGGRIKADISDFIVKEILPSGEILSTFENEKSKSNQNFEPGKDRHSTFTLIKKNTDTIIADFAGRYQTAREAHEQIIMAAIYFNAMIFPESNKFGGIEHITNRGYRAFLMDRPDSSGSQKSYRGKPGMPSNQSTIEYYTEHTKNYVDDFGHKLQHLRVVTDFLDFDPSNTTKFDSAVAASYSIVASRKPVVEKDNYVELSKYFGTFDHSKEHGQIND